RAQAVRIVRDDAGDAHLYQAIHVGTLVDGPGDDLEPERLCFGKRCRGHVALVGRPHRTAGRGHHPWHRAGKIIDVQPRRPWRCARPPALQGVAAASIDAQADALDLRRDAARNHERAPIEGLNADPCAQSRLAHRPHHGSGKRLRVRRVGARRRRQFGFNIETDMLGLRLPRQIEYLQQCRDADAIHSPLLRKGPGVARARLQASTAIGCRPGQCGRRDRGPSASRNLPSGARVWSGLRRLSWLTTRIPSLVMARSSSSVVTPIDKAMVKAASVFSGAKPRAPRWPCRSNATAAEHRTKLTATIAAAMIFAMGALQARAAASSGRRLRHLRDAIMTPSPLHEWRWRLARSKPTR